MTLSDPNPPKMTYFYYICPSPFASQASSVIFVNENENENENAKIAKLVTQRKCQHTIRRSIRCADVM